MMRIKTAMKAIETALEGIPLVESFEIKSAELDSIVPSTSAKGAAATL
jgi:hypothetical protein